MNAGPDAFPLSLTQQRLLLMFYRAKDHRLTNDEITGELGIGSSTFSAEQRKFVTLGLLEKQRSRCFKSDMRIRLTMSYQMTEKGKLIGLYLERISKLLRNGELGSMESPIILDRPSIF